MFNTGSGKISRPVTPCRLLPKTVMLLLIIRNFYCLYFLILVKPLILWITKYYWENYTVTVLGVIFTLGFGHIWRVDCNMLTFSEFGPLSYKLPQAFSRVVFSDLCCSFYILTIFIGVPISLNLFILLMTAQCTVRKWWQFRGTCSVIKKGTGKCWSLVESQQTFSEHK